jgi:hypothetical protein
VGKRRSKGAGAVFAARRKRSLADFARRSRAPDANQRSVCGGKKEEQGSGRSFRRKAETELSGLCDDAAMQEQGVSKILTINLNDMAKELKIK